jgi:hypothetical protein
MDMHFKSNLTIAGMIAGLIMAQAADASHYRGGAQVLSVDANGLVSITATSFWRTTAVSGMLYGTGGEGTLRLNGTSVSDASKLNQTRLVDISDSRFTRVVETYDVQLREAGLADFTWSSCCHVSGAANTSSSLSEELTSKINWDGQNANAPIYFDFSAINPEVVRGQAYNDDLAAVAGNGGTLTYDNLLTEGIYASTTPAYVVDAGGVLRITAAETATMTHENPYAINPGADYEFSGNIYNSDGSRVEFEWMWDAVNTGSANLAPVVNDLVINVFQGDVIAATVTGSDPDLDPLTWNLQSLFGPGDTSGFSFNPGTQGISWNTAGVNLGTYIANIRASDGSLTDTGTVTINISSRDGNVPEPGMLSLFGLGIIGLGLLRRRKIK